MEVLVHLANIKYDYKKVLNTYGDEILLKVKNIVLLPENIKNKFIEFKSKNVIKFSTHQTYNGTGFYQLVIEIKGNTSKNNLKCKIRVGNNYIGDLRYYKDKNIFFQSSKYNILNNRISLIKDPIDISTSGAYSIDIFKNDKLYESINLEVMPSSLSYDDYIEMINQLRSLREGLIVNSKSKVGVYSNWNTKIENIENRLKNIEKSLKQINDNPKTDLKYCDEFIQFNKLKKINSKVLIQKSKEPFKKKFNQKISYNSHEIYEHHAIKYSLQQINKKLEEYKYSFKNDVKKEKNEINNFIIEYKEKTDINIYDKYNAMEEDRKRVFEIYKEIEKNKCKFKVNCCTYVDFNIKKFNGNNKFELVFNTKEKVFEFFISSNWMKEEKEWTLLLSPDLNNKEKFSYRELKIDSEGNWYWGEEKIGLLESKKFSCKLVTSNIDEIIFLWNKLYYLKESEINICAIAEKDLDSNYIFGGEIYGKYRKFTMKFLKIYSINGEKVHTYLEKEKVSFVEEFLRKIDEREIDLGTINEEYNFIKSIKDKEEKNIEIKNKLINNIYFKGIDNIFGSFNKLNITKGFYNVDRIELKPTQIFMNDSRYRKIYKNLKKLDDEIMYSFEKSNNYILINSTQNIFELWCLFSIVDILINDMKWTLVNKSEIKSILDQVVKKDSGGNISDLQIDLFYEYNSKYDLNMKIIYEGKIYYENNKFKCPDYQLIISKYDKEIKKELKKSIVYLDAKYRNYDIQGEETFIKKDIIDVAIKKYIKTFIYTKNEPIASMIVHSFNNPKYEYYGGGFNKIANEIDEVINEKLIKPHSYGGFPLVPSNKKGLKTFLKLILEYHLSLFEFNLPLYEICWNCGELKKVDRLKKATISGYEKFHYKCEECKEFWVKNHCSVPNKNHDLIKHIKNYHEVKDGKNPWYVICPICGDIYRY